jgi:hypothetical protein
METLEQMAEKICRHIPEGMEICLRMENGDASVTLGCDEVGFIQLPDSADKTLQEQLNDALLVANGWHK